MHFSEYKRIEELENIHFWYRAMEESVLDLVKKHAGERPRILDAGCGTGGMSRKMGKYGSVVAADINRVALEYAKNKNIKHLLRATVENLPIADDQFDITVCLDVLYHTGVKDDMKALAELYRTLKRGGLLILRLPAFEFLRGAHDVTVQTRHRYTLREVKNKLEKSGFTIQKLSYANMILSIPLLVKRSIERIRKKKTITSDTSLLPVSLNNLFYLILKSENYLLRRINLPFGSSVIALGRKP